MSSLHVIAFLLAVVGGGLTFPSGGLPPSQVQIEYPEGGRHPKYVTVYLREEIELPASLVPIMATASWTDERIQTQTHGQQEDNTLQAQFSQDDVSEDQVHKSEDSLRKRRSTQPTRQPQPGQSQPPSRGGVGVDVQRDRAGTHVRVDAERNVYRSNDGRTSVDAQGSYSRVYNGPGASRPNYNAGVRLSHRW